MENGMRSLLILVGISLGPVGHLPGQQADEPQRRTLVGLRFFAVHARVQVSEGAALPPVDEHRLRSKIEREIQREGMRIVGRNDVRDGPGAHLSLLYLVAPTRDNAGRETGFAAMSCLQAEQTVSVPRLGRYVYTVAPTWRSCGLLAGNPGSYRGTIEHNADEQILRFLEAWRSVNAAAPPPEFPATPEPRAIYSPRPAMRRFAATTLGRSAGSASFQSDTKRP